MDAFLGEIKICAFPFVPRGWAACNGALLPVRQNAALFALLGDLYGGDGRNDFALPNLQGRTAVHRDFTGIYVQGHSGGAETVQLNNNMLPTHTHYLIAAADPANSNSIGTANNRLLGQTGTNIYGAPTKLSSMENEMCSVEGGGEAHENMQPSLVINYIIAISGYFPPRW